VDDAVCLAEAGVFAFVLEGVPPAVAERVTRRVDVPTIGIGAGPHCDGQVLVTHDLLGLFDELRPRFVKQYADLGQAIHQAVAAYCREVREGAFPAGEHSFR
jgi:3-methyl-2-oxobutanoate hydroxymethyltransferase